MLRILASRLKPKTHFAEKISCTIIKSWFPYIMHNNVHGWHLTKYHILVGLRSWCSHCRSNKQVRWYISEESIISYEYFKMVSGSCPCLPELGWNLRRHYRFIFAYDMSGDLLWCVNFIFFPNLCVRSDAVSKIFLEYLHNIVWMIVINGYFNFFSSHHAYFCFL